MMFIPISVAPTNSTAAYFRAWGKAICDAIKAVGWVQTADTGQIDWSTVEAPTAANQMMGYMLFRSNDGLAAIYMRLDFGSNASAPLPAIKLQAGTGTDGAGVVSGTATGVYQLGIEANPVTDTSKRSYVRGTPGSLLLVMWAVPGGYGAASQWNSIFSLERYHEASGAPNSVGMALWTHSSHGAVNGAELADYSYCETINFINQARDAQPRWNAVLPTVGTGAVGNNVYLYPVRSWAGGEGPASLNLFMYFVADLTTWNAVTAETWDGVSRSILPTALSRPTWYYGALGDLAILAD